MLKHLLNRPSPRYEKKMAARNGVPIFRGCRSLRAFHRTSRQAPRKRYLSNGGISPLDQPPLNQPLQDMPPSPASMIGGTESWQNRHDHVTHVTTLENGIRVASEDSFGQFSTIGGKSIQVITNTSDIVGWLSNFRFVPGPQFC